MNLSALIARRRALHTARDRRQRTGQLLDAAAQFRARAAEQVAAGRPELAEPFLDEAELFESAVTRA